MCTLAVYTSLQDVARDTFLLTSTTTTYMGQMLRYMLTGLPPGLSYLEHLEKQGVLLPMLKASPALIFAPSPTVSVPVSVSLPLPLPLHPCPCPCPCPGPYLEPRLQHPPGCGSRCARQGATPAAPRAQSRKVECACEGAHRPADEQRSQRATKRERLA